MELRLCGGRQRPISLRSFARSLGRRSDASLLLPPTRIHLWTRKQTPPETTPLTGLDPLLPDLAKRYTDIHAITELSMEEQRTARVVAAPAGIHHLPFLTCNIPVPNGDRPRHPSLQNLPSLWRRCRRADRLAWLLCRHVSQGR